MAAALASSNVLVSFGQYRDAAVKAPGIIGARQSHQSVVIGDSGGYGRLVADGKQFSIATRPLPDSYAYRGSPLPFPFAESPVGRLLTLGDLCVAPGHGRAGAWDELSNSIVTNHNLERMLAAFEQANRLADLAPAPGGDAGRGFQGDYLPPGLLNKLAAVRRVFDAADPLSQYKREGAAVWGGAPPVLSDDDETEER